jgi:hypothetical protein
MSDFIKLEKKELEGFENLADNEYQIFRFETYKGLK